MRVRLLMELALHEQMYLDNEYLTKGCPGAQDVAGFCCIYSEQYVSSSREEVDVSATYQREVMAIRSMST